MSKLPDLFIVVGFVSLMGGLYRLFGPGVSLIVGGVLFIVSGVYPYLSR
jgi:hypothetical protein